MHLCFFRELFAIFTSNIAGQRGYFIPPLLVGERITEDLL